MRANNSHRFFRHVHLYFPILCQPRFLGTYYSDRGRIPLGLLAGIYYSALQFWTFDDDLCVRQPPDSEPLFQIAYNELIRMAHSPTLECLQTALLLLQKRPSDASVADSPFMWCLMSIAYSVAQALALNQDSTR